MFEALATVVVAPVFVVDILPGREIYTSLGPKNMNLLLSSQFAVLLVSTIFGNGLSPWCPLNLPYRPL